MTELFTNIKFNPTFNYILLGNIDNIIIDEIEQLCKIVKFNKIDILNNVLQYVSNYTLFTLIQNVNNWMILDPLDNISSNQAEYKTINDYLINKFKTIYPNKTLIRAFLTKLGPNRIIPKHVDGGLFFKVINRIIIPIVKCNKNVIFTIDENIIPMDIGGIYEINNLKPHACYNYSCDKTRIHLICDVLDNNYIL